MTSILVDPWAETPEPFTIPNTYKDERGTTRKITRDENGIPRDQWNRPVVRKADGRWVGYTRVSGICKELDDGRSLKLWSNAMTLLGAVMDPDLFCRVAEIIDNTDDPYTERKRDLFALAERAQEKAGSTVKRELGTTLHGEAQVFDRMNDLDFVDPQYLADITAYANTMAARNVAVMDSEIFVVVDEIEAAGSFDKLLTLPDGRVVIGDIKTGQHDPSYPMSVEMQIAAYARGERYNLSTGERTPIHPDLDITEGVLIHLPSNTATCELYSLNLLRGWDNLITATNVKRARKEAGRKLKPMNTAPATSLVGAA